MQIKHVLAGWVVGVPLLWAVAVAAPLIGTSSIAYQKTNYVFRNGDLALGFVRLNSGFTVLPGANMYMDTVVSASGGFDLRDSGIMTLGGNLSLDSNVTLTTSGYIQGKLSTTTNSNTIFLGGNLTLNSDPYAEILHITGDSADDPMSGDLIIDGRGNTLTIGSRAQIFVDNNVTLTLRNMTIRTSANSAIKPPILLASPGSKLALDNVVLELGADFQFKQGQLFVHDEVAVTGTSAFVYQSPMRSYITSGATWSFDVGTTFSIAPVTFTDQTYAAGSATSNNFIVLADQTAALSLSGCSLKTTYTGVRLSQGKVFFDGRVAVETTAGVAFNPVTPLTPVQTGLAAGNWEGSVGGFAGVVSWSPDGRYFAVAAGNTQDNTNFEGVYIYSFNGSLATLVVLLTSGGLTGQVVFPSSAIINGVAWSPDGRYLAATDYNHNVLYVFRFNGTSTVVLCGSAMPSGSAEPESVAWSPDGKYLTVSCTGGDVLSTFSFNGSSGPVFMWATQVSEGAEAVSAVFSPDGNYVAVASASGSDGNAHFDLCSFNGSSAPTQIGGVTFPAPDVLMPSSVSWSPDGRFLALATYSSGLLTYRFNGSGTLVPIVGGQAPAVSDPLSVAWSPDGKSLVVGSTNNTVYVLSFNDPSKQPVVIGSAGTGGYGQAVSWSPDGKYVTVTYGVEVGTCYLNVYRCNYVYSNQAPQAFSTGLVFGNSVLGSAYNANVQVNGGARVELTGMMKDDAV
jgi:WD40 repeat protein